MSTTGATTPPARPSGRIIAIDILRGWAILAIVLHHLWDDIRYLPYKSGWYYERVGARIHDGNWSSLPTTVLDAFLRGGYLVPAFMLVSGLSLYVATARQGPRLDIVTFYRKRLRYLLVPYWFSVAMIMAVIVIIAALQVALHGHGLVYQYHHVTESKHDFVAPGPGQLFAMVLVFPRALRSEWMMAPPNVMWFVVLIIQYYLLFPFLLRLLHRVKPAAFLAGALVATIAANLLLIGLVGGLDRNPALYMNHCLAPFRLFEFALGMSLGYGIVHHRDRMRALTAAPATTAALIVTGLALIIGGGLMDDGSVYSAFAASIVITGAAMIILPLLTKQPGRIEATAPARLLAWTGPFSYAVLIANEPLRLIASFLRVEAVPTGAWWLYLVLYMPVTLILARPLAGLLGIRPRSLARPVQSPAHVPAPAVAPAQGIA